MAVYVWHYDIVFKWCTWLRSFTLHSVVSVPSQWESTAEGNEQIQQGSQQQTKSKDIPCWHSQWLIDYSLWKQAKRSKSKVYNSIALWIQSPFSNKTTNTKQLKTYSTYPPPNRRFIGYCFLSDNSNVESSPTAASSKYSFVTGLLYLEFFVFTFAEGIRPFHYSPQG